MKTVKKFTTFEALKAEQNETKSNELSLEKHNAFKDFILEIKTIQYNQKPK